MAKWMPSAFAVLAGLSLSACATTAPEHAPPGPLIMRFAPEHQRLSDMGDGDLWLGLTGSIRNEGDVRVDVPDILVVLEDELGQPVFRSVFAPSLASLDPGVTLMVNKTFLHVPAQARTVQIGWAPQGPDGNH